MKGKYTKPIIIIGILLIIAVIVYLLTGDDTKWNEGYVNGNTAGNLYNHGMFCEHDGTIFFANPNDENKLYSMDSDGSNLKKLSDDVANYINADDNYVYYVRNNVSENLDYHFFSFYRNALCRIPRTGGSVTILDTDPCNYATLIGNYIYYLHYDKEDASTLYKVKIDGTDRKQVAEEAVFTCCTDGQYFYYNGMAESGSVYRFDASNDSSKVIYDGNCYQPTVLNGNTLYYIDGDQNNALVCVNLSSNESSVITSDSIDAYNIYGDYIYYQKYDKDKASGLCRIKKDGSGYQMIMRGDFKNIYITSEYVFFTDHHSNEVYYAEHSDCNDVKQFDFD